jgi:hypothetical protein
MTKLPLLRTQCLKPLTQVYAVPPALNLLAAMQNNEDSLSNGCLMRIAPMAIWSSRQPVDVIAANAAAETSLTHPQQTAQVGSRHACHHTSCGLNLQINNLLTVGPQHINGARFFQCSSANWQRKPSLFPDQHQVCDRLPEALEPPWQLAAYKRSGCGVWKRNTLVL